MKPNKPYEANKRNIPNEPNKPNKPYNPNYPRPTKATPAQMMKTEIHRVELIGSLKKTFDRIVTSTYPRLTVGYATERLRLARA